MGQGGLVDCLQEARTKRAMDLHRRANDDVGKVLVQNLCHTRSQPFVEFVAIPSAAFVSIRGIRGYPVPGPLSPVLLWNLSEGRAAGVGVNPQFAIRNSKFAIPVQPRRS